MWLPSFLPLDRPAPAMALDCLCNTPSAPQRACHRLTHPNSACAPDALIRGEPAT